MPAIPGLLLIACMQAMAAEGIDLDCEGLSQQMIERLQAEGLLSTSEADRQQALAISRELCGGAEDSAQQQHEQQTQQAMDNWLFEKQPEKAGNKRLKNLKR